MLLANVGSVTHANSRRHGRDNNICWMHLGFTGGLPRRKSVGGTFQTSVYIGNIFPCFFKKCRSPNPEPWRLWNQ